MRSSLKMWNVWIVRDGNMIARPRLLASSRCEAGIAAEKMFQDEFPAIDPISYHAIVEMVD